MALSASQVSPDCAEVAALYGEEMSLGRRIRMAREAITPRMTQGRLAESFGLTVQAISGWERDMERPDIAKLPKLARILNTTTDWLLDGHGPPETPRAHDPLYGQLRGLTDMERDILSGMVEGLIRRRDRSGT